MLTASQSGPGHVAGPDRRPQDPSFVPWPDCHDAGIVDTPDRVKGEAMPTVEESITIQRSPDDVWAFVAKTENLPVIESQMTHIEQLTEGEVGLGTRWKGATNVLGRKLDWVTEMVEFEPPRRSKTRSVEGKLPFEVTFTLTPSGDGTELTYRLEAESGLGGVFGRLGDPLVERAQARTVRTNLANLKELLEADG